MVTLYDLLTRYPGGRTVRFADSAEWPDERLALVCAGRKVATWTHRAEPEDGRRDTALTFDVDPAPALAGAKTLGGWRHDREGFTVVEGFGGQDV